MIAETLSQKVSQIEKMVHLLEKCEDLLEKIQILQRDLSMQTFFQNHPFFQKVFDKLSAQEKFLITQVIFLGQFHFPKDSIQDFEKTLSSLLQMLAPMQEFYACIGGILGYQKSVLQLILEKEKPVEKQEIKNVFPPPYFDIRKETPRVKQALLHGIETLPKMAEIYPLGGAADRLHLVDEKTNEPLPAAKLQFAGCTLLEHMIRDLQAREYLYYKLYHQQVHVPIAIMTSQEKKNHTHIQNLFAQKNWFYRDPQKVRFFTQPLVPVLSEEGDWIEKESLSYVMKPGGHGAIWKLAEDYQILDWLKELGCENAIVRQINNPIAGLDRGLICLAGKGASQGYSFGFIGCPRLSKTQEGVHVLVEKVGPKQTSYFLSNIEYCDMQALKQCESDLFESSNTNILFVNLQAIQKAVAQNPYPGALVNFKEISLQKGDKIEKVTVARLETTMQNIADTFEEKYPKRLEKPQTQQTFVLFNDRLTSLSTTKNVYVPNKSILQTPEQCYYDYLRAMHHLLVKHCQCKVPDLCSLEEYLEKGPNFRFQYHAALGPLFSLIKQKIKKGHFHSHFDLELEIADCLLENLHLKGSCLIHSTHPLGHIDENGQLRYSNQNGKCIVKNVTVDNLGINPNAPRACWKKTLKRKESLKIVLHENAELYAEGVTFVGSHLLEVPKDMRWIILPDENEGYRIEEVSIHERPISFEYRVLNQEICMKIKRPSVLSEDLM